MPRTRTLARLALTLTTSLLVLAATALPALAADAATKPKPGENDFLIGSLPELATAAVFGLVLGTLVFVDRPKGAIIDDDHAHDHS